MKAPKRKTLGLRSSSLIDPDHDRQIELGIFDVLLPCRQFSISHKVSDLGKVSITTEFLLRLLKAVDGLSETDAGSFFGFDSRELAYVLREVEANDYVTRKNGRLHLTLSGHGLFREGSEYPEIFEVDSRTETIGFDLISLAPEFRRHLDIFEMRLPELPVPLDSKMGAMTEAVPDKFRRFYFEILSNKDPGAIGQRELYSIDSVKPLDRFASLVRISVGSTGLRPSSGEPDLNDWRPDYERDDRKEIVSIASQFLDELKVSRQPDDDYGYRLLIDLAPNFLKEFIRKDGLAVERYYRDAFNRAGDVRTDRKSVPLLGSVFTRENLRRVLQVIDYGKRNKEERPSLCIWFVPQGRHWGATTLLPELLEQIKTRALSEQLDDADDEIDQTFSLTRESVPWHLDEAFDVCGCSDITKIPSNFELLIVPNTMMAASVSAPIGVGAGLPVPLGLASFDETIVASAHSFALKHLPSYNLDHRHMKQIEHMLTMN